MKQLKSLDQAGMQRATEIADKIALLFTDEESQVVLASLALATAAACVVIGNFPLEPVFNLARGFYLNMLKETEK